MEHKAVIVMHYDLDAAWPVKVFVGPHAKAHAQAWVAENKAPHHTDYELVEDVDCELDVRDEL